MPKPDNFQANSDSLISNNLVKKLSLFVIVFTLIQFLFVVPGNTPIALAQQATAIPGTLIEVIDSGKVELVKNPAPPRAVGRGKAGATVTVNYTGFSPQAQAAFQSAVDIWATLIFSPVEIKVDATFTALGPGVLGSAGPTVGLRDFSGAPQPGTFYPVALANKFAGFDLSPSNSDIRANFSSTANWYLGTDGNTPANQIDFVSVVLHELCHGLGFLGSMTYSSGIGKWGGSSGFPWVFDRAIVNGSNQSLINTFPNSTASLGGQLVSNNLFFSGNNAQVANAGTNPRLFAPSTFISGSSIFHLDESFNGTPNALMTYSIGSGEVQHNPGPVVLGLFRDIGWDIVPSAPIGLTAAIAGGAAGATQIDLSWTRTSTNETGFKIESRTAANATYTEVATTSAGITTKAITGLSNGTPYYFRVRAYNNFGNSGYSNEATATTLFPAPTGLTGSAASSTIVNLNWLDNSNSEFGFAIERSPNSPVAFAQIGTVGTGLTTYQDTGRSADTIYLYRVRAYTQFGSSGYTNQVTITMPPAEPSNLSLISVSTNQVVLGWTDNSNSETGFELQRKTGVGGTWGTVTAAIGANAVTYPDNTVAVSTLYYYRIRSFNAVGNSGFSNELGVATLGTGNCLVTSNIDTGANTLRSALGDASCTTITFSLPPPRQINITTALPNVPAGVTIAGLCTNGAPGITIIGTNTIASGLILQGNNTLFGVQVRAFGASQIKNNTNAIGNRLSCTISSKP